MSDLPVEHIPMPLYHQIKTRLLEAIESGALKPGDRVPSERELTTQFAVSRMTARQALSEMESQGYLYRVQGKGTFVANPKLEQPLLQLTSFTEEMRRRGLEPGARVLSADLVPAGRKAARALGIAESTPVIRFERLRLAGGSPMGLEISHLPADRFPGLLGSDLTDRSLYQVLEGYGIRLSRASQSLESVAADGYEAEILHVREGAPLLMLERVSRDQNDQPVEYAKSLYRGDRYRFTTELHR